MAYLHAEHIDGKVFDPENEDSIGQFKIFMQSDNISEPGHDNVTSIKNWHYVAIDEDANIQSKDLIGKDYKWVRDQIKALALAAGFNTLTPTEMGICVEHNVGTHAEQIATVGVDNLVLLGQQYNLRVMKSRQVRLSRAVSEVVNRLHPNRNEVLDDVNDELLLSTYINGREGTLQDDEEGLTDYIMGIAGTRYASDGAVPGLIHKGWLPLGFANMNDFCVMLNNVIVNGTY